MAILYKNLENKRPDRKNKTINISIDERPERPVPVFRSNKDRAKYIKHIESIIRRSYEYKQYIKLLKDKMGMNKDAIFSNIESGNGKKYTIEVHHEPFTLFDIVNIVMCRRECENDSLNAYEIADEVLELHYEGVIGLISLSKTVHELVGENLVFIPLQRIYQDYHKFYEMYEEYVDENIKDKIMMKAELSLKCNGQYMSDVLDPNFVYVDVEGFDMPQIPDEWGKLIQDNYDQSLESLVSTRKESIAAESVDQEGEI